MNQRVILIQKRHEYVAGSNNVKGDVDVKYFSDKGEAFDIGANKNGYAVFKDPQAAMAEAGITSGDAAYTTGY